MKARILGVLVVLAMVSTLTARSVPTIIPLPQTVQNLPGTFTLCPSQPAAGIPGPATTLILVDSNSLVTAQYLTALLFKSTGFQFQIATNNGSNAIKGAILLTTVNANTNLGTEGYDLKVAPDSVIIDAPTQAGVFYGVQSLLQLLPPQILSQQPVKGVAWTAPCVHIVDQPRFPWRGYMMDESRHFFGKQQVKKMMDAMALHKMNTFHWHLTDDVGWRIQILAYPQLTQVGAWRNGTATTNLAPGNIGQNNGIDFGQDPRVSTATNNQGYYGGFYTQNDVREVVAYAAERHITIVPEIEMPAHASASLASLNQLGCNNPPSAYSMDITSTNNVLYSMSLMSLDTNVSFPILKQIITEVVGLFPGHYIHLGGDEVNAAGDSQWMTNAPDAAQIAALGITNTTTKANLSNTQIRTAYQNWFSTNMANYVQSLGRTMICWSEFEAGGIVPNAALMDWETGTSSFATATATAGFPVVLTPDVFCYMNYPMSTNGRTVSGNSFNDAKFEPYYNNTVSTVSLSLMYSFEPVPTNLSSQFVSNILGAECMEWAEYIPSTINEEFKAFPRMCAMSEVTWTQAALKNFTDFTNRLVTHEQRLTAMGINYDSVTNIQIGTWGPTVGSVSPTQSTVSYNVSSVITNNGDINVDFHYTSGANALNIYSVTLLANGTTVDSSTTYLGFAGLSSSLSPNLPYFTLHLRNYKPGTTYTIQASIAGVGGTASSGVVYITNWN